jgi:predicted PurR-regulated permease PerM
MKEQRRRGGRVFFFGLFILLAVLVVWLLSPYLSVIAIALVTVVMLKPLYDWYLDHKRIQGHTRIATTLTLVSFILLIIIPIFIIGFLLFSQANDLLEQLTSLEVELSLENLLAALENFLQQIPALSDIEIDQEQFTQTLVNLGSTVLSWLTDLAVSLGTSLPNLFIGAIIFLIVVATVLPILDDLEVQAQELSPLDVNITQIYLLKSREMIVSVVKGVFLLAIIQGLIMGVFYWLADVPFTIFWTLLSMAFAILPVVGISFIVLPMALIFLLTGNVTSAVLVLIGFYVFVNPTDLTLRPRLVSKEAYLNFTLMLLALFGGLAVGGLLGMIYGPVIMILFMTTIDIYAQNFSDKEEQSAAVLEANETDATLAPPDALEELEA